MQCRGMQYEVGKTYTAEGKIDCCNNGLHACEMPLDVLDYYPPASSRYFEVEPSGEVSQESGGDTKFAAKNLKIKAEIGIAGLVKAQIEYVTQLNGFDDAIKRADSEQKSHATGNLGAASATGKSGVAIAAGVDCKAMGAIGCAICCVERGEWDGTTYPIIAVKAAIIDGETLKADTWYMLKDGEFTEA